MIVAGAGTQERRPGAPGVTEDKMVKMVASMVSVMTAVGPRTWGQEVGLPFLAGLRRPRMNDKGRTLTLPFTRWGIV